MLLRSKQAQWFETYVPRSKTVSVLNALAGTGVVELESDSELAQPLDLEQIREAVAEYNKLAHRYRELFADIVPLPSPVLKAPEQMATEALICLKAWCKSADDLWVMQLQLEAIRQNLLLLQECLTALHGASSAVSALSHQSKYLYKGVFACPTTHHLEANICAAVDEFVPGEEHNFYFVADLPVNQAVIEKTYRSESCLHIDVPGWLSSLPSKQRSQVSRRIDKVESRIKAYTLDLESRMQDPKLATAIENMKLLTWYADHAEELSGDQNFCHVTGWTTVQGPEELQRVLEQVGIQVSVRFSRAPETRTPPVSMLLPTWAHPFLLFVDMLGTPDTNEVNPGLLLPLMVPLLFGYMFPDVGHGLMIALFSALLYKRWPQGRFLIPCGVSAMLFGIVFGEVFGLEGILEPLWFKPLENPIMILIPPILFGIGLMLLGLVFNGIEAFWRGEVKFWLLRDAAVLVMYGAACVWIFYPKILWLVVVALALVWFLLGQIYLTLHDKLARLAINLVLLFQSMLELLLNTLSFLRVGAFALAHAALSAAVLQIADGIANPTAHVVVMILGHLLIVVLEGMVVFVQTTRLVLFEFFTRFLEAEGRIFRPLPSPPKSPEGKT